MFVVITSDVMHVLKWIIQLPISANIVIYTKDIHFKQDKIPSQVTITIQYQITSVILHN